jgi:hypothetical protein
LRGVLKMDRKIFVEQELSRILKIAKPNLVKCEYVENEYGEICRIHCENGYTYDVCIECNSLSAIVYDVFNKMMYN